MVSLQVPQEEFPLTVASAGNCRRSSPYSTRQAYFAELARGFCHRNASAYHRWVIVRGAVGRNDGCQVQQRGDDSTFLRSDAREAAKTRARWSPIGKKWAVCRLK